MTGKDMVIVCQRTDIKGTSRNYTIAGHYRLCAERHLLLTLEP